MKLAGCCSDITLKVLTLPFERWPGTEDFRCLQHPLQMWSDLHWTGRLICWDQGKRISLAHLSWAIWQVHWSRAALKPGTLHLISKALKSSPHKPTKWTASEGDWDWAPTWQHYQGGLPDLSRWWKSHIHSLIWHRRPAQDGKLIMVLLIPMGPWHFNNAPNFTFNTPLTTIMLLWWKPKSDTEAWATSFNLPYLNPLPLKSFYLLLSEFYLCVLLCFIHA